MKTLITVLDNITETSMPFNEFVIYRANHYPDEKQILFVCGKQGKMPQVEIPDDLEIIYTGRNPFRIRQEIGTVLKKLNRDGISYAIHMHQVRSGFLAGMAMLGTGFRKKVLFTVHSTFSGYKIHNKVLSFINTLSAQQITCVSDASYKDYPGLVKKIKKERIRPLQNGVDTERIETVLSEKSLIEFGKHSKTKRFFVYAARLVPLKNHGFLVDVLEKCDESVNFIFVGAEDPEKKIRKKAEEKGVIDRITFTGLIPRNEVFAKLKNADFYISASTLEGMPVSVLEAMYCGLPCVLSDIPQHREIGCREILLLPFDADEWARQLNRLASSGDEEIGRISKNIKNYVQTSFSLKKMHEKYDRIYKNLY